MKRVSVSAQPEPREGPVVIEIDAKRHKSDCTNVKLPDVTLRKSEGSVTEAEQPKSEGSAKQPKSEGSPAAELNEYRQLTQPKSEGSVYKSSFSDYGNLIRHFITGSSSSVSYNEGSPIDID